MHTGHEIIRTLLLSEGKWPPFSFMLFGSMQIYQAVTKPAHLQVKFIVWLCFAASDLCRAVQFSRLKKKCVKMFSDMIHTCDFF